ncbi:amino acid transporter [Aspergillus uvarum CBS 121591]|uniref:Amino acid transporter n=1 Tax=Aspergillus uvarum CBS 121591 TaxID=1448315 RepID=A0A319DAW4_9EURO|nr:amino acid transporter [Aspergillus uvarum CBS 121591]PYH77102.1 amino acid transporter [Aspergillus uvarum CBS 121591]
MDSSSRPGVIDPESALLLPSGDFLDPDGLLEEHTEVETIPRRHLGIWSTAFLITNRMIGTAIFSTPSAIAASVRSAGAALALWTAGFLLSLCGLMIWLELASLLPRSGGEKVYLNAAYPRPPLLATTIYATHVICLGFTGIGSIAIAENLLLAVQGTAGEWTKRFLAIAVMTTIAVLHIKASTLAVRLMNVLASAKIVVLVLIIITGLRVVATDQPRDHRPGASFDHPFAGSSTRIYDYTTALFKILATYQGWSNAAYVLDEVQNPRRTLKIASVLGVGSVGILYILVNAAYFSAASPEELSKTGVTVVALLVGKVWGETAQWCTALVAALSSFGSLLTASFSMSRVIQALAREGVLPFAPFFASSTSSATPKGAFLALFMGSAVMILLVPFGDAYSFLLDVGQYAFAIIYLAVVVGLFIIRRRLSCPQRTFRVWTSVAIIFLATQIFLVLSPFLNREHTSDTSLPFWLMPTVAILALSSGWAYWYGWWELLPRMRGFVWKSKETVSSDGTRMVAWIRQSHDD